MSIEASAASFSDLTKPEAVEVYLDLVRDAEVVIEGMRPGALARRGLGYERLAQVNPAVVVCTLSGFGAHRSLPQHAEPRHRLRRVGRVRTADRG